jgi:hypothetical protein
VKELSVKCWPCGKGEKAAYLNLRKLLTRDLLRIRNHSDEISLRGQLSQKTVHVYIFLEGLFGKKFYV